MSRRNELAAAYVRRSQARLVALEVLLEHESWADVVRQSQEIVELLLKALLRSAGVSPPRLHDVSDVLIAEQSRLPEPLHEHVDEFAGVSRRMRRDRELAFYGAEDLVPSAFYSREDAETSRDAAQRIFDLIAAHVDH